MNENIVLNTETEQKTNIPNIEEALNPDQVLQNIQKSKEKTIKKIDEIYNSWRMSKEYQEYLNSHGEYTIHSICFGRDFDSTFPILAKIGKKNKVSNENGDIVENDESMNVFIGNKYLPYQYQCKIVDPKFYLYFDKVCRLYDLGIEFSGTDLVNTSLNNKELNIKLIPENELKLFKLNKKLEGLLKQEQDLLGKTKK